MKRKLSFLFILFVAVFVSCTSNSPSYTAPSFKETKVLSWEHVSKELEIMMPYKIFEYKQWIILIAYIGPNNDTFFLYDKRTGECIKSGIKHANGPKETTSGIINVSLQKGILSYYDFEQKKRVFFSIDNFVQNGMDAIKEEPYEQMPWTMKVAEAGNNLIFFRNTGSRPKDDNSISRIEMIDKEGKVSCYSKETIEDPDVRFFLYMQPQFTVSPDCDKLAVSCSPGATILETFSIKNGMNNLATKYFFEPKVMIQGDILKREDDSQLGILELCSTDKWIIASYDGDNTYYDAFRAPRRKASYTNIALFDWYGNPGRLYRTRNSISKICIEQETETVYAVIKENDGSYYISRAKLN